MESVRTTTRTFYAGCFLARPITRHNPDGCVLPLDTKGCMKS
jgi:hypothetical protein